MTEGSPVATMLLGDPSAVVFDKLRQEHVREVSEALATSDPPPAAAPPRAASHN